MFDRFLIIHWDLNLPGLEYTRVVNMPRLHMVLYVNSVLKNLIILNVLSSEYAKVLNVSGV